MSDAGVSRPERRRSPRRRVLKRGKILFHDRPSVIDCTIRDISEGGARLLCSQAGLLPKEFFLVFVVEKEMRNVRIIWRTSEELGVEFLSAVEPARLRL
ncbi:PilZ domain-containing protein [Aestuariivirga sp.]|jgi:hypothetical protein|uniref:PilZ domain-containing protein n=1 Tax=Aestuariivirga sp. TaxID=2650926 RepID=UPI003784361A